MISSIAFEQCGTRGSGRSRRALKETLGPCTNPRISSHLILCRYSEYQTHCHEPIIARFDEAESATLACHKFFLLNLRTNLFSLNSTSSACDIVRTPTRFGTLTNGTRFLQRASLLCHLRQRRSSPAIMGTYPVLRLSHSEPPPITSAVLTTCAQLHRRRKATRWALASSLQIPVCTSCYGCLGDGSD